MIDTQNLGSDSITYKGVSDTVFEAASTHNPLELLRQIKDLLEHDPSNPNLQELIKLWQQSDKPALSAADPFPDYIDSFSTSEAIRRINKILGIKSGEPNPRLEYISLFDSFSEKKSVVLDELSKKESRVYDEMKACDSLLTEIAEREAQARRDGKESFTLDEALQNSIQEFQKHIWPTIVERNPALSKNHPFPIDQDPSSIRVDECSKIKSRLSLVVSELNKDLSNVVRDIERVTRDLGHLIDIVSHFTIRDPMIDRANHHMSQGR